MVEIPSSIINYLSDGTTDTLLLLVIVIIDTVLGLGQAIKNNKSVTSKRFLSGILMNFVLSLVPSMIMFIGLVRPSASEQFLQFLSAGYSILLGAAFLQSIMANLSLLGVKLPDFLLKWLESEITNKENKDNKNNANRGDNNGQGK